MQFTLVDRITDLQPGRSITAVKALSLAEEYLQDHFPRFPVMPGVLMLEAMFQASAWLILKSEDFAYSIVTLREARNVKYADFVEPGQVLTVTSTVHNQAGATTTFKAQGIVNGQVAVSGRLVLERYNLADSCCPERASTDAVVRHWLQRRFETLFHPKSSLETAG